MKALGREQADSYRYNGFLFPLPALTPEEIATCLAGLDRLEKELGSPVADAHIKWRSHARTYLNSRRVMRCGQDGMDARRPAQAICRYGQAG